MNVVLDDAAEVFVKTGKPRRSLGEYMVSAWDALTGREDRIGDGLHGCRSDGPSDQDHSPRPQPTPPQSIAHSS